MGGGRRRASWAALAAPLGFGLAVAVLLAAGDGDLAAPPIRGFGAWLEARGAIVAAVALLRLAALGAAMWMFVVAAAVAIARLAGAGALAARLEAAVPRVARHLLTGLVGVGATGAVVLGGDRNSSAPSASPAVVQQPIHLATAPAQAGSTDDTVTMSLLPESPAAVAVPGAPAAPAEITWTVAPGESFWSIADELLADDLGRPPTDGEIVPYWRALIEANREALVSGDPDLIFPGQVFTVPARPSRS